MRPSNVAFKYLVLTIALLKLTGCTSINVGGLSEPIKQYLAPIELNEKQLKGVAQFKSYPEHKAIAVSKSGHYGYGYLADDKSAGARSALYWCQHYSPQPCRIHLVDENPFQNEYTEFARKSSAAIANMKVPGKQDYNLEGVDWNIATPTRLRQQETERYDSKTPLSLTGIRTIKTVEVAQMLISAKPVLIDAQGWDAERPDTIPGAYIIDWAGTEQMHLPGREEKLQKNFEVVMRLIEADKTKPVIVFCHSTLCWLSINAALRLQAIGYSDIYWYRGGKESWSSAGLPLIPSVPHATIWLPN